MTELKKTAEGWPELPKGLPPKLDLPAEATPMQLARVYASSYLSFGAYWEKSTQALEFLYGHAMSAKSQSEKALGEVEKLESKFENLEKRVESMDGKLDRLLRIFPDGLSLPPMRPEFDSSHQFVDRTTNSISDQLKDLAKKSPGPREMVTASPDTIVTLIQHTIAEEAEKDKATRELKRLQEAEAANKKTKEDAEKAAEEKKKVRDETARQIRIGVIISVLSGLILAIGGFAWGSIQGRSAGHAEGVVEGRQIESGRKP